MPLSALTLGLSNFQSLEYATRHDTDLAYIRLVDAAFSTFNFIDKNDHTESAVKAIMSTYFICLVKYRQLVSGRYLRKEQILAEPDSFCLNEKDFATLSLTTEIRARWKSGQKTYLLSDRILGGIRDHLLALLNNLPDAFIDDALKEYFL